MPSKLSRIEEAALIARVVAMDDRRAFSQLVEAHQQGLKAFLMNLCGSAALTDDLAQESFIKAWHSLRSFEGVSRFKTWLYAIAVREFYSWHRSQHPTLSIDDVVVDTPVERSEARLTEVRYDVAAALRILSPTDRALILLFYYNDFPIKKISNIMNMNEGAIKTRLHRAKARMATFLNHQ